jgi:hypothetical protein
MFENEIIVNRQLLRLLNKIARDVPEASLYERSPGHGHPPAWILGHLAMVGELGQAMLGGAMAHPEWRTTFGPGSTDAIEPLPGVGKQQFVDATLAAYAGLQERAAVADPTTLARPHGISLFENTPIETLGHCVTLMLTSHFGFHLAQLSSCRRTAGHPPLF